jgi:flagellar assembly factor FliW
MPWCDTNHFGRLEYTAPATLHFAEGMPGFESQHRFVVIQQPQHHPLVFLQSLDTPDLCFPALPAQVVEPGYRPCIAEGDLELLGLPSQPRIGEEAIVLALIAIHEEDPTANLLAPVVINLTTRAAAQCIDAELRYSHRHHLTAALEIAS